MTRILIEWDPNREVAYISEENSTGSCYHVSGNWPGVIDNLCGCLHDFMEDMDREEPEKESDKDE